MTLPMIGDVETFVTEHLRRFPSGPRDPADATLAMLPIFLSEREEPPLREKFSRLARKVLTPNDRVVAVAVEQYDHNFLRETSKSMLLIFSDAGIAVARGSERFLLAPGDAPVQVQGEGK